MKLKAILIAIALVACQTPRPVDPNFPQPEQNKPDDCTAACKHGEELKCDAVKPSPNGMPCVEICRKNIPPAATGWRPLCQAVAPTCVHFDECVY